MKLLCMMFTLFIALPVFAEDSVPSFETVVEDVIFNTSTRVVIDEKTIKESRSPNVTTLLATQANVTITNTPFQPNSIYIRGGDASHVLIIIDGVPFYDASTIQRTLDLNSLDIKSVRRIEIIKGSQTVLYGGQALSGVIKIDTIPQELNTKTALFGRAGTQSMMDLTVLHTDLLTENQGVVFRGHGSWRSSESPVLDSKKTYDRNNWNGEGTYVFKGPIEGNFKANYIQDLNNSPSSNNNYQIVDAEKFEIFTRQLGLSTNVSLKESPWTPRFSASTQNSLKTFKHPIAVPKAVDDQYGANLQTLRLDVTPLKTDTLVVVSGISYTHEDFIYRNTGAELSNSFSEQRGLFAKADYFFDPNVTLSFGARVENWDNHNPVSTYQAGLTLYKNTKLEFSTGYKIPSLFQMYSTYGNPDLKEERVNQYSLSQDFQISDRQQASITFFQSSFSNLIVTAGSHPNLKYTNVNSSETKGAEFVYTIRPTESSSLLMTYGYQEPRDIDKDRWLARRPLVNGSIKYLQSWNKHSGSLELMGTGERLDRSSSTVYISLPGYMTANASYSYNMKDNLTTYVRLNNLANHRYQETYSYYTEGFSGLVGFEYWF